MYISKDFLPDFPLNSSFYLVPLVYQNIPNSLEFSDKRELDFLIPGNLIPCLISNSRLSQEIPISENSNQARLEVIFRDFKSLGLQPFV